jgi:hypothetical protein
MKNIFRYLCIINTSYLFYLNLYKKNKPEKNKWGSENDSRAFYETGG